MLDRNFVRQNPEAVKAGARRKGVGAPVDEFIATDTAWRAATHEWETTQAEANTANKSIGALMGQGEKDEAKLREIERRFPSLPHESVPDGKSPNENVVVREWGEKPLFAEPPHKHFDIAAEHRLIDFERAAKISGSGFAVYTGLGAKLHR